MMNQEKLVVGVQTSLEDTMARVDSNGRGIVFVVDEAGRLVGSMSDGDIRRAILKHTPLDVPVRDVMNPSPTTISADQPRAEAHALLEVNRFRAIPKVDSEGRIVEIVTLDDPESDVPRDNVAVVMCGGFGRRLKELTRLTPKPMLNVGQRPILETIASQLASHGFRNLVLATHYKAEKISEHFGDGDHLGLDIDYIREEDPRGTAGALKLMDIRNDQPLLVVNGDILTKVNFDSLLAHHEDNGWQMTMCTTSYDFRIPFGVVDVADSGEISAVREKPLVSNFVNAGIYVVDPCLIELIPPEVFFNMTDLVDAALANGHRVGTFPIHEYWIDIGRADDYDRANREFDGCFTSDEDGTEL